MHSPKSDTPITPNRISTFKLPTTREGVEKWLNAEKAGSFMDAPERLEPGTKSSTTDPSFPKDDLVASTSRQHKGRACTTCR